MYAGLTTADKPALLDAKKNGALWIARDEDGAICGHQEKPEKSYSNGFYGNHWKTSYPFLKVVGFELDKYCDLRFIQWSDPDPVNIGLALAQIAEMESKPIDESATDDIVLAEVYSLREKLKIAADRLESQEREIERLKRENDALYRIGMGRDGVLIPKKEYEPIRFCKVPIADAIPMVEGFATLTARAEQAERERDAAIKFIRTSDWCAGCENMKNLHCDFMKECANPRDLYKLRGLPQDGEGERCRVEF